jgi:tetratricopeptide (TPR) repeat protein
MPAPPRVGHINEFGPVPGGVVPWHPLRRELGVTAFGVNAFSGDTPGQEVIEEHDELGGGAGRHEELYVVVSGRAAFTIDGEAIDAPAGTLVFVPDPASRRKAEAAEPGTLVLVVGGPQGEAYSPSPWETSGLAALYARGGDEERARAAIAEALADHPDHGSALYNVACAEALLGERDAALEHLARALELSPKAREWVVDDEDLASIRDDPRFPAGES